MIAAATRRARLAEGLERRSDGAVCILQCKYNQTHCTKAMGERECSYAIASRKAENDIVMPAERARAHCQHVPVQLVHDLNNDHVGRAGVRFETKTLRCVNLNEPAKQCARIGMTAHGIQAAACSGPNLLLALPTGTYTIELACAVPSVCAPYD